MYTASLPGMDINITSDVDTWVLVEIPAMGVSIGTFEMKANKITVVPEVTHDAFLAQEGISNKGIHIRQSIPLLYMRISMPPWPQVPVCVFLSVLLAGNIIP